MQASDSLIIHAGRIGQYGVSPRRNLLRQLDLLGDSSLTLFYGAVEVDVLDLIAEIRLLLDERDEAVSNLELHCSALVDILFKISLRSENQSLTAI